MGPPLRSYRLILDLLIYIYILIFTNISSERDRVIIQCHVRVSRQSPMFGLTIMIKNGCHF